MGCSPSSGGDAKNNSAKNKNIGTVDVEDPVSGQKTTLKFSLGKLKKDDFLMNLMNALFFGEDHNQNVDVCFQSLYFPGDDRYHYYMYRLLHVELESIEKPYSGKMWVLYLAGKPLDWDSAVNSNMKIDLSKGSPKLLWKYEKFPNPTVQQQGIVHQTSQTANLSYLKKFYEKKNTMENQFTTKYDTSESNNLDYFLKTNDDTKFNTPASKNQGVLRNSSSNRNIALNNGETLSSYARRNYNNNTSSSLVNLNVASSVSGKMYPNVPKNSEFAEKDNNCSRTMEDAVINTEESNTNGMILSKGKNGNTKRAGSNLRDVSIFNPEAKDRPNPNKIILSNDKGNTNVYISNNQQRLNTEEDNRNIQAPLQTEAAGMNGDTSFDGFEGKRFVNVGGQGGASQNNRNNNNNNTNDMDDCDDNGIILPADLLPKKPSTSIMLKNITLGTTQQKGMAGGKKVTLNEAAE